MIIGVPKEIKCAEFRVGMTPSGVDYLTQRGHKVLVQGGAGIGSGFSDKQYVDAGAELCASAVDIYRHAELIVKVKEPQEQEYPLLRKGQLLFSFLHFAASETLTRAVMGSGCTAIAFETVEADDGSLPLLYPMSEIAGRMASLEAAKYLGRPHGGNGVLMSGVPGVEPATVVIAGAGTVGSSAARIASGIGAVVYVLDLDPAPLRRLSDLRLPNVITVVSNPHELRRLIAKADVFISGVLIHGAKAPRLLTREMLKLMKHGSVAVDVAIDQGGSFETSRATTHQNPVYIEEGIVHYCVANIPGAVPRTSTISLANCTLPYINELAEKGYERAVEENDSLRRGVNIVNGRVVCRAVADAFGLNQLI